MSESELIQLWESIYEAALEPRRWEDVVSQTMQLLDARSGKVGSVDFGRGVSHTVALRGIDPDLHERWQSEYGDQDLWARAGVERLAMDPGVRTATGQQLVDPDVVARTPVYRDILDRCGIEDTVSTALAWSDSMVGWLAVYRGPDQDRFGPREILLQDAIGKQARRAFALGRLVERERGRGRALIERLPCAAFVCEGDGRIVGRNRAADALLLAGEGIRAPGDRLGAIHHGDRERLRSALAEATQSAVGQSLLGGSTLRVRRGEERAPLAVFIDPLPPEGVAADDFALSIFEPVALVLVSDPELHTRLPAERLAVAFGLTPAQSRLLAALCTGESPGEYADRSGIARETARTHVKHLLAKTGARRQSDVVRLALESVARLAPPPKEG